MYLSGDTGIIRTPPSPETSDAYEGHQKNWFATACDTADGLHVTHVRP